MYEAYENTWRHEHPHVMAETKNPEFEAWNNLPEALSQIILKDEVEMFVPCMMDKLPCPQNGYGLLAAVEKDAQEPTYCPKNIASYIFSHGALNCATALLEGETGLTLNPNHPGLLGRYMLHEAASEMSYDLVDLLLRHGAQTDLRTTEVQPYTRGGLLPLNVVVEKFSLHCYLLAWTPKQSIFKLIIIFCLPQMKAPLEICKLLAISTMDVVEVFNGYCMDGKLVEVVALLMVAREKLIDTVSGRFLIRNRIAGVIGQLTDEEVKLRTAQCVQACKNKMTNLRNTLLVLEVFERAGDAIGTYVQTVHSNVTHTSKEDVVNEVKQLLVERGFHLTLANANLSDIDCENGNISMATKILESKLIPPQQGISLRGGSWLERENVAIKILHNKKKNWAISGFFADIPFLEHGHDISRRNLLLRRHRHGQDMSRRKCLYWPKRWAEHYEQKLPLIPSSRRGYVSIAWAAKKGMRYL